MRHSFVWKIENFSYCFPRTGDVLKTPKFGSSYLQWTLSLYPRGRRKADQIVCRITREEPFFDIQVKHEFSFLNGVELPLKKSEPKYRRLEVGEFEEYSVSREEIFQRRKAFMPNDTLTIKCMLWPCDVQYVPMDSFATTHIRVDRMSFVWSVLGFSNYEKSQEDVTTVLSACEDCPDFKLRLCSDRVEDDGVGVRIFQIRSDRENLVRCRLSLLTNNNLVAETMSDEMWFHRYRVKKPWDLPAFFTRDRLFQDRKKFLPGDVLSLRCELHVSMGECKAVANVRPARTPTNSLGCQTIGLLDKVRSDLGDDLRRLYKDRLLSDFKLKVGSKTFHVHKSLLVARSAVFRAMFEKGMLDDKSGILEVPDLDPDTVSRMLAFMYCGELEQTEWESTIKLYNAAGKYHLLPLKDACRAQLGTGLNASNAWEVLLLADRHQDEDLRQTVLEFILEQEKSIIESEVEKKKKGPTTFHEVFLNATSTLLPESSV